VQGVYTSPRALLQDAGDNGEQRALDAALSMTRGSISHVVAASPPAVAALLVFEELAHMTRVRGRLAGRRKAGYGMAAWAGASVASAAAVRLGGWPGRRAHSHPPVHVSRCEPLGILSQVLPLSI
jgi:hypothetical protein